MSGGQTGVDRAALDAARALGVAYGGYLPRGRWTEDGPLADDYVGMVETNSAGPAARTRLNVLHSEATLILVRGEVEGGTALTLKLARQQRKPHLVVDLDDPAAVETVLGWLAELPGGRLNVAGPRDSKCPGIYSAARAVVEAVLASDTAMIGPSCG